MGDLGSDTSTGPNIQISGATCLSKPYIEVFSPSIPLHFNRFDDRAMDNFVRLLSALRHLCHSRRCLCVP
jgi:hypothetical protein